MTRINKVCNTTTTASVPAWNFSFKKSGEPGQLIDA